MGKTTTGLKIGLMVGLITLVASPAFARSISLKGAGTALWIFVIIGATIVLLQAIPAAILFFSFVGTSSGVLFNPKKLTSEGREEVVLPAFSGRPARK